ncbi:MAG: hypothetical protein ACRD0J_09740 [Acidimicrobiales bacterium]
MLEPDLAEYAEPVRVGAVKVTSVAVEIDGEVQVFVTDPVAIRSMPMTDAQRRLVMSLCGQVGLGREERIELAEILLSRDVQTYKGLNRHDAGRLIDALNGHLFVRELLSQRPELPMTADAGGAG